MTLQTMCTQVAQAPGLPDFGRTAVVVGSGAEWATCGRKEFPGDQVSLPGTDAAWLPRMAPARLELVPGYSTVLY